MNRIKEVRVRQGLTQAELAERMGVSQQMISKWENNIQDPGINAIARISKALGVNVEKLIKEE